MTDSIHLQFSPTEQELLAAVRTRSMRAWSFRGLVLFLMGMFVYAGIQAIVYNSAVDLICFSLAPALVVAAILGVFTYANPLLKKRIRQDQKYTAEQTWEFSEENVVWKTEFSETQNNWQSYKQAAEYKNFFLLYVQGNRFAPIPKRAFANADALARFRDLLKRKIAKWE